MEDPTNTSTTSPTARLSTCGVCFAELGDQEAGWANTSTGERLCDRCFEIARLDRELDKLRRFNVSLARLLLRHALETSSSADTGTALAAETAEILDELDLAA